MGRLTTHVLDTMAGTPTAGLEIEHWTAGEDARQLKTVTTNADGRVDAPLLEGDPLHAIHDYVFSRTQIAPVDPNHATSLTPRRG